MSIKITREVVEDLGDIKEITVALENGNALNISVMRNGVEITGTNPLDVRSDDSVMCYGVCVYVEKDD